MEMKTAQLRILIDQAKQDPVIAGDAVQTVLNQAETELQDVHNNYIKTAVRLTQAISQYYLAPKQVPQSLQTIDDFVKTDADADKLDSKTKRELGVISGYIRPPFNDDKFLD
ncbi:hypothetical protein ACLJJ6_02865 [Pediococcus siamensis]|uniref:hypothetical protein n=1 Tax=Pediococcus siamensis TaxID=381829 RepID=UPI0039A19F88